MAWGGAQSSFGAYNAKVELKKLETIHDSSNSAMTMQASKHEQGVLGA